MSTAPQAITERYVSNLLHYGRNKEFDIDFIKKFENIVDDEICGVYFCVRVDHGNNAMTGNGATVSQALRRALEKHGVTFR